MVMNLSVCACEGYGGGFLGCLWDVKCALRQSERTEGTVTWGFGMFED